MQKTNSNETAKVVHRQVGTSTILNRKYVKRPAKIVGGKPDNSARVNMVAKVSKMQDTVNSRMRERNTETVDTTRQARPTAKELKEQAIQKALAEATIKTENKPKHKKGYNKIHFGFGRVLLALSCAAMAVFAIVYFVNLNMPDISLKVAAMQTGFDASYPSYIPRDYKNSSITSEDNKVTLEFTNSNTDTTYTLTEEPSSWDSNALMTNYVKSEYGEKYITIREQGLTIYISGSNAAWVNGGVVYKIKATSGTLTNKQIKTIATSL